MMIDSHCHLDFEAFEPDRQQVLDRCKLLGVSKIVIPGVKASSWSAQIEICNRHPQLLYALGLHPYFLCEYAPEQLSVLRGYLSDPSVLAVGEIGLDFAIDIPHPLQLEVFEQQLKLAADFDLPVIVHHRKSHHQIMHALRKKVTVKGGMIHAFSGSIQQAEQYIKMGFLLGVGGGITYPRASKTRFALEQIPLENLLLETDAPDMPLCGYQGQRNTPERLPLVANALAELKGVSLEQVARQTTDNFSRCFLAGAGSR